MLVFFVDRLLVFEKFLYQWVFRELHLSFLRRDFFLADVCRNVCGDDTWNLWITSLLVVNFVVEHFWFIVQIYLRIYFHVICLCFVRWCFLNSGDRTSIVNIRIHRFERLFYICLLGKGLLFVFLCFLLEIHVGMVFCFFLL